MYDEVNTKCNLPAQIDIEAVEGAEYRFVMVAKGGGSANKTYFYPMTKATIQNEGTLIPFLVEKMKSLGTAACPPYHICFVIGGTSAEKNLLTVKLGSIKYYDNLPTTGDETGRAFRDIDLEEKLLKEAHKIGLGAQFGGKYLAHDIRIIRLPRHGASCPIGMGVSCSADRNIKAKINKDGIWLEKMDTNPSELIPEEYRKPGEGAKGIEIDLDKGMDAVRAELTKYPVSTRVNLKVPSSLPVTSLTLSSRHAWMQARSCQSTSRTTLSSMPDQLRLQRATHVVQWVLPLPTVWTHTLMSSRHTVHHS